MRRVADSHWGRSKTILVFSSLYLAGHGVLAAAADSLAGVLAGLVFVAFGAGAGPVPAGWASTLLRS